MIKYEDGTVGGIADMAMRIYGRESGGGVSENRADVYYNRYEASSAVEALEFGQEEDAKDGVVTVKTTSTFDIKV